MQPSDHNQSKAIAALLCPLLRSRSPKVPFRCFATENDRIFRDAEQSLRFLGVRKGIFQSRRNYVIESFLFIESCFETAHYVVELHTTTPNKGAWTCTGEFKQHAVSDVSKMNSLFEEAGMETSGPNAIIEIDVSAIWSQISPLLESLDATERTAERHRQSMAALQRMPKYKGPPATPEQAAEIERIISELLKGKQSNPTDENT